MESHPQMSSAFPGVKLRRPRVRYPSYRRRSESDAPQWLKQYLERRAGPLSTLSALAATMAGSKQEVKQHCMRALSEIGASVEYCAFFGEVLQCEHDMNNTIYRLQQNLRQQDGPDPIDPGPLLKTLQDLTKNFHLWRGNIDALAERGKQVAPLTLDPVKVRQHPVLKVLCCLDMKDIHLKEGEEITITDASRPNKLGVRTSLGQEGFVPALCCILPSPDRSALTASERLRVQLLCSWTECVRKIRSLLMESLAFSCRGLSSEWRLNHLRGTLGSKDRVTRRLKRIQDTAGKAPHIDFNKLHNALFSLEKELGSMSVNGTDLSAMIESVANLDKSVLCYQMFHRQWQTYRRALEKGPRPIRVVEHILNLRPPGDGRNYKYYEYKMTMENLETVEEILYVNKKKEEEVVTYGLGHKNETVSTDQITSTEQEEKKRFVIKGVVDPRNNNNVISIKDAVMKGIVDQERGMYVNPDTGEGMAIPEAMGKSLILVEYSTVTRSAEKTKAVGLISIKTKVDNRQYTIQTAVDAVTGEHVSLEEAKRRGLIQLEDNTYLLSTTGQRYSIDEAVQGGWIDVEYDEFESGEPDYETKTYAVSAVVDQRMKKRVPFYEAVKKGLIDVNTGNYVNNVTHEKLYVADAIRKGFIKAKQIEDASGLDIDAENRVVVERMDMIRKNVLKGMGVISAFKRAHKKSQSEAHQ